MRSLEFLAEAEQELASAVEWYDRAREGLGTEFLLAIESRVIRLKEQPWDGFPSRRGTRSISVDRFPYVIVFLDRDPIVYVIAIAHTSREPDYWARRLDTTP